jgi:hypothetical protein
MFVNRSVHLVAVALSFALGTGCGDDETKGDGGTPTEGGDSDGVQTDGGGTDGGGSDGGGTDDGGTDGGGTDGAKDRGDDGSGTGTGEPLPPTDGELIFHSGFEPDTTNVGGDLSTDITGIDLSLPPPNDWVADLESYPLFGQFGTGGFCDGATVGPDDHKVRIVDDPTGATNPATGQVNRVLHMWNRNPDGSTCGWDTRPHSQIGNVSGDMPALYFKFRLYLDSDMQLWVGCPGWLQIWETKRELANSDEFFSIEILLAQDDQTGDLYWIASNRICCGGQQPDWRWHEENRSVPVPYDEWVTAEIYWQKGTEETGRFVFTLQSTGEEKEVVFDVTGATVPPDQPDTTMYQWKMATVYTSVEGARCVDDKGGVLQAYWDDWEVWDGYLAGG